MPGLAHWTTNRVTIEEPRLAEKCRELLQVPTLSLQAPPVSDEILEEKLTGIKAFRFPLWFITQEFQESTLTDPKSAKWRTRLILNSRESKGRRFKDPDTRRSYNVVPIRFVRGCPKGHIDDIDWYDFVHTSRENPCRKERRRLLYDERGTSGDLSEVFIRCSGCGTERSIIQATLWKSSPFGICNGQRRWLGPNMEEDCNQQARLLVRGASNAYFPQNLSVISLPERDNKLKEGLDAVYNDFFKSANSVETVRIFLTLEKPAQALEGFTAEEVWAAIEQRRNPTPTASKPVKVAELETLMAAAESDAADLTEIEVDALFTANALPPSRWKDDQPHMAGISRVVLVHRLREVTALLGFTRFEASTPDATGDYDLSVGRAPLSDPIEWIPARENRGEGIFLLFDEKAIASWLKRPAVKSRIRKLEDAFKLWEAEHKGTRRYFPGGEYVLLHSFSHLLLTAISLECGYPASSIRERIYSFKDQGFGVLLFTSSSDAEGTLGGIIEAGRNIASLVKKALQMGQLCSSDPVCSEHDPSSDAEHRFLHGAACHGCLLISETCCEMQNDFLDRALVVSTIGDEDDGTAAYFEDVDA